MLHAAALHEPNSELINRWSSLIKRIAREASTTTATLHQQGIPRSDGLREREHIPKNQPPSRSASRRGDVQRYEGGQFTGRTGIKPIFFVFFVVYAARRFHFYSHSYNANVCIWCTYVRTLVRIYLLVL